MEKTLKKFTYNRWLIGFIIIGLAAALAVCLHRHKVEENNTTVEMVVDYEGLVQLAEMEGLPVTDVLAQAKEAGITSLAVYETTLKKLSESGKVTATAGADVIKSYSNGTLVDPSWRALVADGTITADNIYVASTKPAIFAEVRIDLIRRFGAERVVDLTIGSNHVLAVKANYEKGIKWHLGMPSDEMKSVEDAGFYIVARPTNYEKVSEDDVRTVFERIAPYKISDVVFSDKEVLGATKQVDVTAALMKEHGYTLGLIEHPLQLQFFKQEGLMELAQGVEYQAARVYSIPKDEQVKMKLPEAVERWITTDQERNIRINLLRIFEEPQTNMTLMETNMKYFTEVKKGLVEKGFTIGKAGTYEQYYPSKLLLILITMGAVAAGVLYVSLIYPIRDRVKYMMFGVISLVLCVPYFIGTGNLVRTVVALASASLFPALAMTYQLDRWKNGTFAKHTSMVKIIVGALVAIFTTTALSFIGGAYVGSVLADIRYLLEVTIFRGVKLTFVMPIILVGIAFLTRFNLFEGQDYAGSFLSQVKKILNTPIYVKSLVAFAIAGLAALIFIGRSGHTAGVPVPGIELKFRAFLEQALYARPRSKELLIGHPAFMLAIMAVYKKWPRILFFCLVIVATIGQGSLVETFAHIRTPIFMSFVRGLGGVILGAGVGIIAMFGAHLLYKLSSYIGRDTAKHE